MPWAAAAIVGAAVIGAVASNNASQDQQDAAGEATDLQRTQYDQTRADNAPWQASGESALNRLNGLMNNGTLTSRFDGANVANEPGYAFGMQQGMRAIDNSASARGGIGGAALKAGTRYAQDYAGTKYNDAFNRWNTENTGTYNRLANIAGLGQQAVAQVGNAGANYANQAGANALGAGNAQAANTLNQGNIYGNTVNQLGAYGRSNNWWQSGSGGGYNQGVGGLGAGGSPDGYW